MFAISLLRDPSKVEWPIVEIDNERNKCESYIEIRLYDAMLFNGYDAKTQVPCGSYRIDLALPKYRLAIECDGKAFHSTDRKSTRLNSSHVSISYAVFCLKKKKERT